MTTAALPVSTGQNESFISETGHNTVSVDDVSSFCPFDDPMTPKSGVFTNFHEKHGI